MRWALRNASGEWIGGGAGSTGDARCVLSELSEREHAEVIRGIGRACRTGVSTRLNLAGSGDPVQVEIQPMRFTPAGACAALIVVREKDHDSPLGSPLVALARRNEAILRSAMDGFFVVDEQCRFLDVNDAFCRMLGYTRDELMGLKISDLEAGSAGGGGVPSHTRTGLHHFPMPHRHKDGHIVHLELSVNVLHDEGQKILVGFARDVTERNRTARELARLTWQQKLILHSAGEGIVGLDREGQTGFVNPAAAEMLGASGCELVGQPAHTVLFRSGASSSGCSVPNCPICAVLSGRQPMLRVEATLRRADGTAFPAECSITSMCDRGELVGAVLVFKDMSERLRQEQERRALELQVQQSQRMESLGLLAGGIAHDLNNMLVGILGNACLALDADADATATRERLQRIVGVCERASKVIQQILAYSGQVSCQVSPLDLNVLVRDMTEFMRAAVPRSIALNIRTAPDLPPTEADAGQLQQVIANLLVNAVEAIGDRVGTITLSTHSATFDQAELSRRFRGHDMTPGPYVCLQVEDDGCGMTPETLARIFEPFYSIKGTGRGLGLAAMRGIVRAHRGGICVESQPGTGSRFLIALPALESSRPQPAPPSRSHVRPGTVVLVIDDDLDVRDVVTDMLSARGLRALSAADGPRGIELFRQHHHEIDVVLLDMTMPSMSGGEVHAALRAIAPDVPVIVFSGYSEQSLPTRFGEARPLAFLQKPFTADTLMQCLADALAARQGPAALRASFEPQALNASPARITT